MLINSVSNF